MEFFHHKFQSIKKLINHNIIFLSEYNFSYFIKADVEDLKIRQ
jgi:hypothetical protein